LSGRRFIPIKPIPYSQAYTGRTTVLLGQNLNAIIVIVAQLLKEGRGDVPLFGTKHGTLPKYELPL